jgi:hypothetical protein
MAGTLVVGINSCINPPVKWLDLEENQTVHGIVRLRAKVSTGARNVSFRISYQQHPSDDVLKEMDLVVEKTGSTYWADWPTQNIPDGRCYLYATADFGDHHMTTELTVNVQNYPIENP